MGHTAQYLDAEVARQLQYMPKYSQDIRLAALSRGQDQLAIFIHNDDDPWQTTTQLGTDGKYLISQQLPAGTWMVHAVSFDGYPLDSMTLGEWKNTRGEVSSVAGIPIRYWIDRNQYIYWWPRPSYSAQVQVYLIPKPNDFIASDLTAESAFQEYCSPALISFACWDLLRSEPEELERSDRFYKAWTDQKAEAKVGATMNTTIKVIRRNKL
jgi:hypothetical protein